MGEMSSPPSQAVLLCRQPPDRALGISSSRGGSRVLVTVQGDGVVAYDAARLAACGTRTLGSSQAQLLAPVQQMGGVYLAAVRPQGSAHGLLVAAPAVSKHSRPLLDEEQRVPLPSALHSLHVLHAAAAVRSGGCAAAVAVLADGGVAVADFGERQFRPCSHGAAGGAAAAGGRRQQDAASLAAASDGRMLAVARQLPAGGGDVTVELFAASSSSGGGSSGGDAAEDGWQQPAAAVAPRQGAPKQQLPAAACVALARSVTLACPSPGGRLAGVSLSGGMLAVLWQDGSITAYHHAHPPAGGQHRPGGGADAVATFPAPASLAVGGGTEGRAAATPQQQQQGGRKRRAPDEAGAGGAGKLLCAAVSDTHLLLVSLPPGAEARHAVLDSRYGCCVASGPLALEAVTGAGGAQLLALPGGQSGAPAALLAGGCVYLLHLQLPKADLAGLVARMALASGPEAAAEQQQQQQQPGAAAAGRPTTARQQLNLAAIAAAASQAPADQQGGGGACVLRGLGPPAATRGAAAAAAADAGSSAVESAAERLMAAASKQPAPAAELKQAVRQLTDAIQQQQQQQQQSQHHHHHAGRKGRGQHSGAQLATTAVFVSQRVLAQGLAALAETQEWAALGELHSLQPLQSLAACPGLLPALAAAQQFTLMRQVLLAAQDVPAESLVGALRRVLLPARGADADAARRAEARIVRAAAAEVVAHAEAAAAVGGGAAAAGPLLAAARRAAAAVDGFAPRELLAHALLAAPVDAVEAGAALRLLPTAAVLRLLRYCCKWVDKYASLPLREDEAAAAAGGWALVLPAALAAPSWGAALEWSRLLLDAHLARLAMLPAAGPLLSRLQQAVQAEVGSTRQLVALKGVTDHLALGAPLPMVAEAASSQYTLELLDLRVSGR